MARKVVGAMATTPSAATEKSRRRRAKATVAAPEPQSRLRTVRIKRGLTQIDLARLAGMHRNSIRKLENGMTQEITPDNARALAAALRTTIADLGLRVRATTEARSIRIRRLSSEQRQIIDELLSLPPEDYGIIRGAIDRLRKKRTNKPPRGGRR